jgi:DNA-binding transcriptional regulator YiaG
MTQQQLADDLATRQATISEWECGKRSPQRAMKRALMRLAERAAFTMEKSHV